MKFSLTYKMLLVVAIPLALQLIFLGLLSHNLSELANEQNIAQNNAKAVMARDQIVINERQRTILATIYLGTMDQSARQKYIEVCNDSPQVFNQLAELWKGSSERKSALNKLWKLNSFRDRMSVGSMPYQSQKLTLEDLLGGSDPNKYVLRRSLLMKNVPFIEAYCEQDKLQQDTAYAATIKRLKLLNTILYSGLAASILATIVCEFIFSKSVSKRLRVVLQNIQAFGNHQPDLIKLKGSDEISALNEAVISTANKIRDAEEFQAQTTAIIAEELNKPLTEVQAILQELPESGFEELSNKGSRRLADSLIEINRLEKLVFELVNLDSANRKLDIVPLELDMLVASCVKVIEPLAKLKSISVTPHGASHVEVHGDNAKTTQVLINLLSNAIKFSPQNSTIDVRITAADLFARVEVIDHGTGIPIEFQSRIFKRFEQANTQDKPTTASSGLGLVISKEIIEAQGGEVGFDSSSDGSTFWFTLPSTSPDLIAAKPRQPESSGQEARSWKPTLWKKALLVVALPTAVQLVTVAAAFNFLQQNSAKITQTQNISRMTELYEQLMTGISRAGIYAIVFNVERDPAALKSARQEQESLRRSIGELEGLADSDATAKKLTNELVAAIRAHLAFEDHVIAAKQNADTASIIGTGGSDKKENLLIDIRKPLKDLFAHQNDLIASNNQALEKIRQEFATTLFFTAIGASIVAAAIGLAIARNLTNKMNHLSNSALNFSKTRELVTPTAGDDEIAYIEQQLHAASTKLMNLEVARAEMVGITSHELRTPLTSLIALIEVVEAEVFGPLTAKGQTLLTQARLRTGELIVLITNLLDLEKMESGKILVTKQKIKVENVFEQVKLDNALPAVTKDITLNIMNCNQELDGDSYRLSQALTAVIRSLIERTPAKSAVSLDCTKTTKNIVLTIGAPHGVAAGRTTRNKEFARERMATNLARMTARQHGGDLNVTTSSKGRMFELLLPLT